MSTEELRNKSISGVCSICHHWVEKVVLDHIVPLFEGGVHDTMNLQWVCTPCHDRKTRTEASRRRTGVPTRAGIPQSEETKEKLRQVNLGRKHSPETIEKIRQATLSRPNPRIGMTNSPESNERRRQTNRETTKRPEVHERRSQAQKERWRRLKDNE